MFKKREQVSIMARAPLELRIAGSMKKIYNYI
jgi:hypothetical protein